jgi:hypothetical protein
LEASLKSEKGWTDFLAVAEPLLHLARLHLQQLAELHQARVRRLHIVKSSVVDPDPDPLFTSTDPDPYLSIIKQKNEKNLISTVMSLLYDVLPVFRIRIRRILMFLF